MTYELVEDCLNKKFSRYTTGDIKPLMDFKDGAYVNHPKGCYKAFTSKASADNVVIVLSQLDNGNLTYEGEYQLYKGDWGIYK